MSKRFWSSITVMSALLLLGAGCSPANNSTSTTTPPPVASKPADQGQNNTNGGTSTEPTSDLTLSAEALGNRQVRFAWTAPNNLTEANRFIIVEGNEMNPVHDGRHQWFRQYYPNRTVIWGQRPTGTKHYRICLTENNKHDTCVRYSNDVVVEVK